MATQSLTLQPGNNKMPLLGFGTWKVSKETAADVVYKVLCVSFFVGLLRTFFTH